MNRRDFQELSRIRLREADALLAAGLYDGAYYLYGYVIECALKACIAKDTQRFDFPERDRVNKSYTHNLAELVIVAQLKSQLDAEVNADQQFARYWEIVKAWRETSRYSRMLPSDALEIEDAITHRRHGVMRWLRKYW
ncbi:MAG: HEPN domain-containing protein [Chloroflexi bacterium]|nr:HEPN domain-containing protein [Chloroflexota bacterium]